MQVAIVGAGMSGLALAGALTNRGVTTRVFEQASRFTRVGAGIQQSANAVRVLRALGLEASLRAKAFVPADFVHRAADTGEVSNRIPLGECAEARYGPRTSCFTVATCTTCCCRRCHRTRSSSAARSWGSTRSVTASS